MAHAFSPPATSPFPEPLLGKLQNWLEASSLDSLAQEKACDLSDSEIAKRFIDEDRRLTLRNARIGCWFVIILMPLCTILDVLSYPQHLWSFLPLRLASSLIGVALLLGIDQPFGSRNYRLYPALLPIIPSLCICYMIHIIRDPSSHYYAGLCICMVATCFVFNWTFKEILITLTIIVAAYFAATIPHLDDGPGGKFPPMYLSNVTFLLMNCTVLLATSFQHRSIRVREFLSRCLAERRHNLLREQNEELISTIDRLHQTEAQLNHSERLASIGRLSAGIIHEINNPLNFVKSALYVLNKKTKAMPPELADSVKTITRDVVDGVDRVAAIVSDLRTFAHPDQRTLHPVDVAGVLTKAQRFLAKDIQDQNIRLEIKTLPGLRIMADDREVLQVVINLVQNSIDALQVRQGPAIRIHTSRVNGTVQLHVEDNGCGISPECAAHIFDPFYTTKEVGKGMGLGLSICYRMMQQMEGDIEVESVPGEFTRFTLTFNEAAPDSEANPDSSNPSLPK